MASKNFVVKNGVEVGNSTVNGTVNSTSVVIANSTTQSLITSDQYSAWNITSDKLAWIKPDYIYLGTEAGGNSTAVFLTQNTISVQSNVVINTTAYFVGNSTANDFCQIASNNITSYIAVQTGSANLFSLVASDQIYTRRLNSANSRADIVPESISISNTTVNSMITSSTMLTSNLTLRTSLVVGNSTVNTNITSSSFTISNATFTSTVIPGSLSVSAGTTNTTLSSTTMTIANSTVSTVFTLAGIVAANSSNPATDGEIGVRTSRTGGSIALNSSSVCIFAGRQSNGAIVSFYNDAVLQGQISSAGGTVTYGTFNGSHWSQLKTKKKEKILRGTVVETINELCEWPKEKTEHLAKFKISDTRKSKNVYGVFMDWDVDDEENNDALISSLGTFMVRIGKGVTVNQGDLLQSAGDGTAEPQEDDIIRSSTIGKVTANVVIETYKDGSYLVPCVLYCG